MPDTIKDGSGKGYLAKVNSAQQLFTRSVTESESEDANEAGKAYNINTGNITLTTDADTPILYIKNNELDDLIISTVVIGAKTSSGGSTTDLPEITFVRNPTAGTTIDNANAVDINSNRNYGSSNTISTSLVYKGATGETITDGDDHIFVYGSGSGRVALAINEVLPTGTSIGIKFKPQSGNSSQVVYCAVICYLHTEE